MCINNCINDCDCDMFTTVGSQGPAGPAGPTGATGPTGADGAAGADGNVGSFTIEYNSTTFGASPYDNINRIIQSTATAYNQAGTHEWWFSDYDFDSNDINFTSGTFYDAVVAANFDKIYIKIFDTTDSSKMQLYLAESPSIENTGDLRVDMTLLGGNTTWSTSTNKIGVSFTFVKDGATGAAGADGTDGVAVLYHYSTLFGAGDVTTTKNAWYTMHSYALPAATVIGEGSYLDIDIKLSCNGTANTNGDGNSAFMMLLQGLKISAKYPRVSLTGVDELIDLSGDIASTGARYREYNINVKLFRRTTNSTQITASYTCEEFIEERGVVSSGRTIQVDTASGVGSLDLSTGGNIDFNVIDYSSSGTADTIKLELISITHIKKIT